VSSCSTAWEGGKEKKNNNKPLFHILSSQRGTCPVRLEPSFKLPLAYSPRQENRRQERETNNLQSAERMLQSLNLPKVMEEHSRLGLKFKGMFSYIHPLNRMVENMHKHTLCKLFMLLAEVICTLERGKRYLYLREHNYWINPPSLAKIKDSLSLSPHSLDPEEISARKRKTTRMFKTTEDKIRRRTSL